MKKNLILRVASLPQELQDIFWKDLASTVENRVETFEQIAREREELKVHKNKKKGGMNEWPKNLTSNNGCKPRLQAPANSNRILG